MKFSLIKMVFRRYRKIVLSLVMIAALAVALINGMFNAWESLDLSLKSYIAEYGIADAVISTEIVHADTKERIMETGGVAYAAARLTGSSRIIAPSGQTLTAQIISMDKEDLLKVYHWEDTGHTAGDYVLADRWFAEHNGFSARDVLRIRTGEDEYRAFTVAGVVSSPETLKRTNLNISGGFYPDYGFLYAPVSLLESETERERLRRTDEWKEKEQEYLEAEQELRESWTEGQETLRKAWDELEEQEGAFAEKRSELQEQIRQLTLGRVRLVIGRKELEDAEKTAEEKKQQLEETLQRTREQLLELEDRQAGLTEIRNDLNTLHTQMQDARGRLSAVGSQIQGKEEELQNTLFLMKNARSLWQQVHAANEKNEENGFISEQGQAALSEAEARLAALGISPENLDDWIRQAEDGLEQLNSGKARIQSGIARITRDYLPEIQAYTEETDRSLETVAQAHEALQTGIAEMEAGLKNIGDFEREAPDNRAAVAQQLQEVEEGLEALRQGLEEGERALSEGREQLEQESAEALRAHAEAEEELAGGAAGLREAWDQLQAWEGYTPLRNEFLIWFEPGVTDPAAVLRAAEEHLDVPVQNSELYGDSQVAGIIRETMEPMWAMSVLIPLLFAGIMVIVLFLFLSIMIRQSRRSVGILRALGLSRAQVRRIFSASCAMLMLPAAAAGAGVSVAITRVFNAYYQQNFTLPFFIHSFSWPVFALSTAGLVLLAHGAAALSTGALSRIPPAEAVTGWVAADPKIGRVSAMLLRRAKPLVKFSLLSLRRSPFRFVTSVLCITGAVSMIFAAFSFLVSKNEVLKDVFGRQIRYDAQIIFAEEPGTLTEGELMKLESVTAAERFRARQESIAHEGVSARGTVMLLDADSTMIALADPQGRPMAYPEEGIVLSVSMARTLGVKTGDTVTVGDTEFPVTGISRQMAMECQYLGASEKERFRKPEQTGWLIRLREGADGKELTERLEGEKGFVTVLRVPLIEKGIQELFAEFDLYMGMLVILCSAVGMFIVVNTGRNNLQEQQLSLSVLRALGFQHGRISAHWFLQSVLHMLFSLLLGFAAGKGMAVRSLELVSNSSRHLEYIPSVFQYAMTAGCTFAFILLGHLISMRSMKKWDLAENTKGRE